MYLYLLMLLLNAPGNTLAPDRQLLIFGQEVFPEMYKEQLNLLQRASAGIKERDITIRSIRQGNALYDKYDIDREKFTVILIGKDGGEKHRTNKLLPAADLFALIDAMPMRKAEVKRANRKT